MGKSSNLIPDITVEVPFFRTEHNYDRDVVSVECGLACKDESRAQQHMRDECDINTIVRRFGVTGTLPVAAHLPSYGDFDGINNYQEALAAIKIADEAFADLPSSLRKRFDNDPAKYVEFCSDPANLPELRELGLANPLPVDPVVPQPEGVNSAP